MKHRNFLIQFCILLNFLFAMLAYGNMTLENLSSVIKANEIHVKTGKITFIQRNPNFSKESSVIVKGQKYELNTRDRYSENVIYFDNDIKVTRIEETDLTRESLTEEEAHLDISNTQIFQGTSLLNYFPAAKSVMMDHAKNSSDGSYSLNDYRYGYLKDSLLTIRDSQKTNVSEAIEDGRKIILVESFLNDKENNLKRIVKISPEFGYRCIGITEFQNDALTWEVNYENYKKFGNYFLPEKYSNKRYSNGEVIKEIEISIEDANFGIEFDFDISSIEVPEGTMIAGRSMNPEIPLNTWYTTKKETLTIDSIYAHDIDVLADKEIEQLQPGDGTTQEESLIFIPDVNSTLPSKTIKVFDFKTNTSLNIELDLELNKTLKKISEHENYLLFDDGLVLLGNIEPLNDTLILKQKDGSKSVYEMPKNLPLNVDLKTNEIMYNIVIQKVDANGVYIKTLKK